MRLDLRGGGWIPVKDGDADGLELYERHYSSRRYRDGRRRRLFAGPGEKVVLVTAAADALFVWRKFRSLDRGAAGRISCAVFRNESPARSSRLILAAEDFAAAKWPGAPFVTYVDPRRIRSTNPGCCFLAAGWTRTGRRTKGGLIVLEKTP